MSERLTDEYIVNRLLSIAQSERKAMIVPREMFERSALLEIQAERAAKTSAGPLITSMRHCLVALGLEVDASIQEYIRTEFERLVDLLAPAMSINKPRNEQGEEK